MKYLGTIQDPKDLTTREYVDDADTALSTRINTNEDNIALAESDIESLQTDTSALKTDMTAVKGAVATLQNTYVPNTRKVNGKALSADITLTAGNVGTVPAAWTKINDDVEELVISGSSLGGNIELGFLNGEDGYYYGQYKQNAYIKALYSGKIEVSAGPTTDMGIVNKKFLESKLDIFWAMYNVTAYQEVVNAFNAGKKVLFSDNHELTGLSVLPIDNSFAFITFKPDRMILFLLSPDNVWTVDEIPISPVTSVNNKTGAVTLTASDVGAIPNTTPIPDIKVVTNISCPLSAWVSDTTTYTDYQFKANLTVTGATADYIPLVNFAPTEQESGNYIGATSGNGIVTIWCKSKPSGTITIPNIILTKEN
jgi:hypothetical protein